MTAAVSRIDVETESAQPSLDANGDVLAFLVALAERQRGVPEALLGRMLGGLIAEGRRFAATPGGARWRALIARSELGSKGWMLWNLLEIDSLVSAAPEDGDTPAALLEAVLRTLHAAQLEEIARGISASSLEAWIADA
ncbi:hypothetical protein [Sphingomonas hengshuiensis]|uniref:hypothetical protein n=1 Tax=Sphingomonas hengshuiensis TaxID=1609977 RepID=UPI0006979A05|nr:hypothetical protein [Sphingomonas hengshuiensis]